MSASYKPEGYQNVIPYLLVTDVRALIKFLEAAFGAKQIELMIREDGTPGHGEVRIGDSVVMMGQVPAERAMSTMLYLYVEDCDASYQAALAAGATSINEPEDQFYGDRTAAVTGPQGNQWWLGQNKKQYTHDELQRLMEEQGN